LIVTSDSPSSQANRTLPLPYITPVKRLKRPAYISSAQLDVLTSSSAWLTDDIVEGAQSMLSRQFPQIDSLQSVCLLEAGKAQATVGTPSADWVQII